MGRFVYVGAFYSLSQTFGLPALPAAQGHSGWNKVALLTAVRNSPCSCPFSVSLHPPQAVLNSEPRCIAHWARSARIPRTRWRLLVRFTNLYINNNGDASRPLIFTISYAHPPQGGSHIVQAIFHCALAQFHPFARTDFTARVSALIFRIRRFQR